MLTARFRTGKFVKTTPCTVEAAGIGPIFPKGQQPRLTVSNALPNSLYHIINLAAYREDTHAEAQAAEH